MKLHTYTIKDTKVGIYHKPFFTHDDENAVREATMIVNDDSTSVATNSQDYALYRIGIYDDSDGTFSLYDAPEHMVNLEDLKV